MTDNFTKTKYLLDTNVLIGFALWKPMSLKINHQFWVEFNNALKNGQWILLDVVVSEVIGSYDSELKKWCKEQQNNGVVKKISDANRQRAVEVNNQYEMIDQVTGKSVVDTYIIAYAEENNFGIFSRESRRENANKPYKIPDVCEILHINRLREPKAFLKAIGFD